MSIPFSGDQFLQVFGDYNTAIWPMQFVLLGVAVGAIQLSAASARRETRVPALLLSSLWLWSGAVYHLIFFRRINPAATAFGALFLVQAVLLLLAAGRGDLVFRFQRTRAGWIGLALIGYSLIVYPASSLVAGHHYPNIPTFGAPCPLTIFTLGLVLWNVRPTPLYVIVLPVIWSAIGASASLSLGMAEDIALPFAGILALVTLIRRRMDHHPTRA